MKKFYTFFSMVMIIAVGNAQSGTSCNTAITVIPKLTCVYQSYTTSAGFNVMWFSFIAQSANVNISVVTTKFGINATHIHQLALAGGTCGSLTVIADDELPFADDADKLSIDLNASGLIVGQTYFIRVKREATDTCDKLTCTASGSTNPTTFDLCVENVNVIIPIDFGLELPAISHAYHQNRGQLLDVNGNPRPEIKLYTVSANPAVYITDTSVSYVFAKTDTIAAAPDTMHRVNMTLAGANAGTKVFKTEQISGVTNYFLGHIPKGVRRNKGFERAVINDVYPFIDMQFYSNSVGVKYYFIVRPGGDPNNIIMKFDGANAVNVTPVGGLQIITSLGDIDFEAGHAYSVNPANNVVPMPWQAKFISLGGNKVKLEIHKYDSNMPLFIQIDRGHKAPPPPTGDNIEWSTYLGGSQSSDAAYDITTDNAGNVYIVGFTRSNNFPVDSGLSTPFQSTFSGQQDAFVGKFDKGATPQWITYYGGTGYEEGFGIAFSEAFQKVYFTGSTASANFPFPTTNTGFYIQTTNNGGTGFGDGYIVELNASDGQPTWATFFGGPADEKSYKIAVHFDGTNDFIYITGRVRYTTLFGVSTDGSAPTNGGFPLRNPGNGAYYQPFVAGANASSNQDCFIAKFSSKKTLLWSTCFGGNSFEEFTDIAFDSNHNVIVTGQTESTVSGDSLCGVPSNNGFPLCQSGSQAYFQSVFGGGIADGIVAKFSAGGVLLWSTFFGGANYDRSYGVTVNSANDIFITGITDTQTSPDNFCVAPTNGGFPLCNPGGGAYYTAINKGNDDAFIARFNSQNTLKWSTFYGGSSMEDYNAITIRETSIAVDGANNIYLTGTSGIITTNDFPTTPYTGATYYYQPNNASTSYAYDAFILSFNSSNKRQWATLYGGDKGGTGFTMDGYDVGHSITVSSDHKLYICGFAVSKNFPYSCPTPTTGTPYCQPAVTNQWQDAFISRLDISKLTAIETASKEENNNWLYPNPSTGKIIVRSNEISSIEIFNIVGECIYKSKIINPNSEIDLSSFSDGLYLIHIGTAQGNSTYKIIKQRE